MMVFNSLEQITPLPGPGSKYTVRALLFICVWKEVVQMTPPRIYRESRPRCVCMCGGYLDSPSITITVTVSLERKESETKLWTGRLVRLNRYSVLHVLGTAG